MHTEQEQNPPGRVKRAIEYFIDAKKPSFVAQGLTEDEAVRMLSKSWARMEKAKAPFDKLETADQGRFDAAVAAQGAARAASGSTAAVSNSTHGVVMVSSRPPPL